MANWTYKETVVAFWAYSRIPFKESSSRHPEVIRIAEIIGRTPAALNMKIGNLGRLDPSLSEKGITGLTHGAKMEETVWGNFVDNPIQLALESQRFMAEMSGKSIEETAGIDLTSLPVGREREVIVKQRIGQSFFRTAVLTSYNNRCCISGISNPKLLDACHIVDWSDDDKKRTNPQNGICLNPLFHRAYDKFLIAITPDYDIQVSDELIETTNNSETQQYLSSLRNRKIILPDRFLPNREDLEIHFNKYLNLE